jgi:hypothetical protein
MMVLAATLLFTVTTSNEQVIDALWNLSSKPSFLIQRDAYGNRSPVIDSISSRARSSPPSHR